MDDPVNDSDDHLIMNREKFTRRGRRGSLAIRDRKVFFFTCDPASLFFMVIKAFSRVPLPSYCPCVTRCVRETFSTVQHCVAYSFGQDLSLYWVGFIEPIYKLCMAIASRCTVAVALVHRTIRKFGGKPGKHRARRRG